MTQQERDVIYEKLIVVAESGLQNHDSLKLALGIQDIINMIDSMVSKESA